MGKHGTDYRRVDRDHYPTPAWPIEALADLVDLAGRFIWEPAAGDGRMAETLKSLGATVCATDIYDCGYPSFHGIFDFLNGGAHPAQCRFDGVITNPPFGVMGRLAEGFIKSGLQRITNGFLALLLPADFDSAVGRTHYLRDCPYYAAKVTLTRRIKWFEHPDNPTRNPKENSAWFLWERGGLRIRRPPLVIYAPINHHPKRLERRHNHDV